MKLYQSIGPNPRVVLMYLAETGLNIERQLVDIMAGENRQGDFLSKAHWVTPRCSNWLTVSGSPRVVAICEYLDETLAGGALLGATPEERAQTRMLVRIIDQQAVVPMTLGFRGAEGLPMFQPRMLCLPDAAGDLKRQAADGLTAIDRIVGAGPWALGDRFSLADILLFSFVEFGAMVGQPLDPALTNLVAWRDRVAARPSAADSANHKQGVAEPA